MKLNIEERTFALKYFMSQRLMASVDVFGGQLTKSVGGSRGPPGEGFKITLDGQYDMDNMDVLCNGRGCVISLILQAIAMSFP